MLKSCLALLFLTHVAMAEPQRRLIIAAHTGIESRDFSISDPTSEGAGFGPLVDFEIGSRLDRISTVGYLEYSKVSSTTADHDLHVSNFGYGVRTRLFIEDFFVGAGIGMEQVTQVGTSNEVPGSSANFTDGAFTVDLEFGYVFSQVGWLAPSVLFIVQRGIGIDEGPNFSTARLELGFTL
jgi:hypothetical protein